MRPTPVRSVRVRVSRSQDRISWDGVPCRWFVADVLFDSLQVLARHLSIDYHRLPAWKGEPWLRRVYSQTQARTMQFCEVEPHPRIIRAACRTSNIINN